MKDLFKCFAIAAVVTLPAHAQHQPPQFLDLDILVEYEYPAEIQQGDTVPVYAWITNHSDQVIVAPPPTYVLMRSDTDLFYISNFCRLHCLYARSRLLSPGDKVLLHMGDVYTDRPGLTESQIGYGDMRLAGYTADGQLYAVDVEDVLPITIMPGDMPRNPFVVVPPPAAHSREDPNVIRDPSTGYDWLRFGSTVGISADDLQTRLQPGGEWDGFQIANRYQVQTLVQNQLLSARTYLPRTRMDDFLGLSGLTALKQLVELLQPTGETQSKNFVKGIVSDSVPLVDNSPQYVTLTLYGEKSIGTTWYSSPFGLETATVDEAALAADRDNTGVWLVRGAPVNWHQQSGKATYAGDYLFLPNVLIEGNHYRVDLFRKEGTEPPFVITDISAASAADLMQPVTVFDEVTGRLSVNAVEILSDHPAGKYDLVLEITPETDPPRVNLVNLSPVAN